MKQTLHNKIFKMVAALVLLTTLVLLMVVWSNTSKSIYLNLDNQLKVSQTVIARELVNRNDKIERSVKVLFDDTMFKLSVIERDNTSLAPMLATYQDILDSAFIVLVKPSGEPFMHSGKLATKLRPSAIVNNIAGLASAGAITNLEIIDNTIFWVMWLPIYDGQGQITAYSASGFAIANNFLQGIKQLVGIDVSFTVQGEQTIVVSTLPANKQNIDYLESSLLNNNDNFLLKLNTITNKNSLFSRKFPIVESGNNKTFMYLSADSTLVKNKFLSLQISFALICALAIGLTMLLGRVLAKQITRPLEYITRYAVKISKGDYTDKFELNTPTLELDQLLCAFKAMEQSVKERESEIVFQAQHDMLTRLYNRNYIKELIDKNFSEQKCFQAVGINILGFRGINDVFGYQYGDICLQELAHRVSKLGGTSARLTGGEILWIPEAALSLDQIKTIKQDLEREITTESISLPMKTAIGIIECPQDTENSEDLFRRMNIVIDEAQASRKLLIKFDSSLEKRYLRRLAIINKLKNALQSNSNELSLHYQPKLSLQTNKVLHAEALVRWEDSELGFISPEEFINIAEHAGFITSVTQWVLTRAVLDFISFKEQGVNVCLAVNISAQDLLSDSFMQFADELLAQHELDHNAISFELTEGVIVREPEKAIDHMLRLRNAGFHLAIDDFGTGYSSLSYLAKLPVNILKIDRCFVMPLATQAGEQAICKSVIQLAKSFNMQVVAEGVEDAISQQMLTDWGCEYAQGYHISRPISAQNFINWMHEHENAAILI